MKDKQNEADAFHKAFTNEMIMKLFEEQTFMKAFENATEAVKMNKLSEYIDVKWVHG